MQKERVQNEQEIAMSWLPSPLIWLRVIQFYPYNIKEDTHPLGALWELPVILPSDGHASTATLLSLDASLAISPCVLRLEASRRTRIPSPSRWAFGLVFEAQTEKLTSRWFCG